MYRYKLPTSTRTDWDTYDVSFREIDETTMFTAKSTDNINMTKKWLMSILSEKATATFGESEFYVGNHFVPNISFVISSHKEGQCLIQLEPYYLEINDSFGFLVDYKFKPFHGYEKTRQEKILSLSLSSDGSKNKNYYLQDIINLSGANWRGFNAKHEPVSTLYPELIAKFAGKFDQYGLNLKIGNSAIEKVWFI